jgi:hypothetical protein
MAFSISARDKGLLGLGTIPFSLVTVSTTGMTSNLSWSMTINSNLLPGLILNRLLASAGRVTCPLLVTVAIIPYSSLKSLTFLSYFMPKKIFVKRLQQIKRDKGRDIMKDDKGYQLRKGSVPYKALFGVKNDDIASKKPYF